MRASSQSLGWIDVSEQLLVELLKMPDETAILAADTDMSRSVVRLLVRHNDLRELEPSESIPTLNPTVTHHPERYEWNWGQPSAASEAREDEHGE